MFRIKGKIDKQSVLYPKDKQIYSIFFDNDMMMTNSFL